MKLDRLLAAGGAVLLGLAATPVAPVAAATEIYLGALCRIDNVDPDISPAYSGGKAQNPFVAARWMSCSVPRVDDSGVQAMTSATVIVDDLNPGGHVGCAFIASEPVSGDTFFSNVDSTGAVDGQNLVLDFDAMATTPGAYHFLSCYVAGTSPLPVEARSGIVSYRVVVP